MNEEMLFEIVKKEFNANLTIRNGCINAEDWEKNVEWHSSVAKPSWDTLLIFKNKYDAEYARLEYARKRKEEYPKIEELVVALYDTQDRAEIDKRRADVKKKYPKGVTR